MDNYTWPGTAIKRQRRAQGMCSAEAGFGLKDECFKDFICFVSQISDTYMRGETHAHFFHEALILFKQMAPHLFGLFVTPQS